jgi:hypothetical protein
MEFEVMSREKARKMSFKPDIKDCIIISITDTEADLNHFAHNPHIRAVLNLKFDDVDFGEDNCITPGDGVKVIEFVNKHINHIDKIVVHCEAGVSRSAAICAALGLVGLAGGAAVAGCCAHMVGFAVISFKENGLGGLFAQGIGTSMLQMGNIIKNPKTIKTEPKKIKNSHLLTLSPGISQPTSFETLTFFLIFLIIISPPNLKS